eukprot:snap_masked-scaffold_8-processed-gene-14.47-mRNA-1 protein AED:1.00 eAED:1.00 QI:0/-1/0/0/-1/1/1/0/375
MRNASDGWDYLRRKRQKLDKKNLEFQSTKDKLFFKGVRIYVSGYSSLLTAHRAKELVCKFGGKYSDVVTTSTTHFICNYIPDSKAMLEINTKRRKTLFFVKPTWLLQCVKQKKRVQEKLYAIEQLTASRNLYSFFSPSGFKNYLLFLHVSFLSFSPKKSKFSLVEEFLKKLLKEKFPSSKFKIFFQNKNSLVLKLSVENIIQDAIFDRLKNYLSTLKKEIENKFSKLDVNLDIMKEMKAQVEVDLSKETCSEEVIDLCRTQVYELDSVSSGGEMSAIESVAEVIAHSKDAEFDATIEPLREVDVFRILNLLTLQKTPASESIYGSIVEEIHQKKRNKKSEKHLVDLKFALNNLLRSRATQNSSETIKALLLDISG